MKKNYRLLLPVLISCYIISCTKADMQMEQPINRIDSAATYKIIITGTWKSPAHTVPVNNHFTQFIGMVHNSGSHLFQLGMQASRGIEDVAEVGYGETLQNEITSYISNGDALSKFALNLSAITGTDSTIIQLSSKHAVISFASMIAPSPDWFVGLDSYRLIQQNDWVKSVTVHAVGYDAGTEEGDVFAYNNAATSPQQKVSYLTPANASVIANGNPAIAPFVTVQFIKQ